MQFIFSILIFSTSLKWKKRSNQILVGIKKSFALFDLKLMRSLYLTFIQRLYLEFAESSTSSHKDNTGY